MWSQVVQQARPRVEVWTIGPKPRESLYCCLTKICLFVFVGICVCPCEWWCRWVCLWPEEGIKSPPCSFSTYSSETKSLSRPRAHNFSVRLQASTPVILLSHLPWSWGYRPLWDIRLVMWKLGSKLWFRDCSANTQPLSHVSNLRKLIFFFLFCLRK